MPPLVPATPFAKLIEWLETVDAAIPPWPTLNHRPRVASASVHLIFGSVGREDFALKGAWMGTIALYKTGYPAPWGLGGVLPAQPTLPTGAPNPHPEPLTFSIRVGYEARSRKYFGGLESPMIDAKWNEGVSIVINADTDPLAPVIVGTLEDFADDKGDRFPFSIGPSRSFIP